MDEREGEDTGAEVSDNEENEGDDADKDSGVGAKRTRRCVCVSE